MRECPTYTEKLLDASEENARLEESVMRLSGGEADCNDELAEVIAERDRLALDYADLVVDRARLAAERTEFLEALLKALNERNELAALVLTMWTGGDNLYRDPQPDADAALRAHDEQVWDAGWDAGHDSPHTPNPHRLHPESGGSD